MRLLKTLSNALEFITFIIIQPLDNEGGILGGTTMSKLISKLLKPSSLCHSVLLL